MPVTEQALNDNANDPAYIAMGNLLFGTDDSEVPLTLRSPNGERRAVTVQTSEQHIDSAAREWGLAPWLLNFVDLLHVLTYPFLLWAAWILHRRNARDAVSSILSIAILLTMGAEQPSATFLGYVGVPRAVHVALYDLGNISLLAGILLFPHGKLNGRLAPPSGRAAGVAGAAGRLLPRGVPGLHGQRGADADPRPAPNRGGRPSAADQMGAVRLFELRLVPQPFAGRRHGQDVGGKLLAAVPGRDAVGAGARARLPAAPAGPADRAAAVPPVRRRSDHQPDGEHRHHHLVPRRRVRRGDGRHHHPGAEPLCREPDDGGDGRRGDGDDADPADAREGPAMGRTPLPQEFAAPA